MNPFDLFQDPLTFVRHERDDIHYIGEALPAPSQAVSVLTTGTPASVGGSAVPAREDHVHALDLQDLIDAINEDEGIDLSNYYTKDEIDTIVSVYALNADLVALATLLDEDYYTAVEVDALFDGFTSGGPNDHTWSYTDQIVDPALTTYSDRWYPPTNITITHLIVTVNVPQGSGNYTISLWEDGVLRTSVTLTAGNYVGTTSGLSIASTDINYLQVSVAKATAFTGEAEDMSIIVRFTYD